ncbi:hypothetical protein [Parvularcula lutaonensis]|uniref:SURF1-like protein n=1 Tax=Parvularcula lutaonensis TaxID=491923 RepID=A0ABV7MBZ3_9PROT|nr:hypothetical protein [Parvularcula lutaonensis]
MAAALSAGEQDRDRAQSKTRAEYPADHEGRKGELATALSPQTPTHGEQVAQQAQWWEERDLQAQERMARWTVWIGVATWVGIALLSWTLWETRRVTVETKRIGEAQTRAYLSIIKPKIIIHDYMVWGVVADVVNSGNSPAKNVEVKTGPMMFDVHGNPLCRMAGVGPPALPDFETDTSRLGSIAAGTKGRGVWFTGDYEGHPFAEVPDWAKMYVAASVRYQTVFQRGEEAEREDYLFVFEVSEGLPDIGKDVVEIEGVALPYLNADGSFREASTH